MLESRIEDGVGTIIADEGRIQQVLWNLLSNAVKFTPRGGLLRLATRSHGGLGLG